MTSNANKIQIVPMIFGFGFIVLITFIIHSVIPHEHKWIMFLIYAILFLGLVAVVYFSIKNIEFREKVFKGLNIFGLFLTRVGLDLFESGKNSTGKTKKKRVPISKSLRSALFDRADNRCQHCAQDFGLDIHHIDENPANNNKNNLIVLCASCHRKASAIGKVALRNECQKARRQVMTHNTFR